MWWALQAGEFDDLPGQGKPIDLDQLATGADFAAKLMKNANVLPGWIEQAKELRRDIGQLRNSLRKTGPAASGVSAAANGVPFFLLSAVCCSSTV